MILPPLLPHAATPGYSFATMAQLNATVNSKGTKMYTLPRDETTRATLGTMGAGATVAGRYEPNQSSNYPGNQDQRRLPQSTAGTTAAVVGGKGRYYNQQPSTQDQRLTTLTSYSSASSSPEEQQPLPSPRLRAEEQEQEPLPSLRLRAEQEPLPSPRLRAEEQQPLPSPRLRAEQQQPLPRPRLRAEQQPLPSPRLRAGEWACVRRTFHNTSESVKCSVCDTPKTAILRHPAAAAHGYGQPPPSPAPDYVTAPRSPALWASNNRTEGPVIPPPRQVHTFTSEPAPRSQRPHGQTPRTPVVNHAGVFHRGMEPPPSPAPDYLSTPSSRGAPAPAPRSPIGNNSHGVSRGIAHLQEPYEDVDIHPDIPPSPAPTDYSADASGATAAAASARLQSFNAESYNEDPYRGASASVSVPSTYNEHQYHRAAPTVHGGEDGFRLREPLGGVGYDDMAAIGYSTDARAAAVRLRSFSAESYSEEPVYGDSPIRRESSTVSAV